MSHLHGIAVLGADSPAVSDTNASVIPWQSASPDLSAVADAYAPILPDSLTNAEIANYWQTDLSLNAALHSAYGAAAAAGQVTFTTLDSVVADLEGQWDATASIADPKRQRAMRFVIADRLSYVLGRAADAYRAKFGTTGDVAGAVKTIAQRIGKTIGAAAGGAAGGAIEGVAGGIPWWVWGLGSVVLLGAGVYVAAPLIAPLVLRHRR